MLNDLIAAIQALDVIIDEYIRQRENLETRYPQEKLPRADMERYEAEKKRIKEENAAKFQDFKTAYSSLMTKIEKIQPSLESLDGTAIHTGAGFPAFIVYGRIRLSHELLEKGRIFLPRLLEFPLRRPLWFPSKSASLRWVWALLLRFLHSVPAGKLEIIAADPLQLGESFTPFKSLFPVKPLFPHGRILTNADEIEAMLAQQVDYVEKLIQNSFVGEIKTWAEYNARHRDNPLPCKVVILVSIPEQLSDRSAVYLERLLRHGPDCGVQPLLLVDEEKCTGSNAKKHEELFKKIKEHAAADNLCPLSFKLKQLQITEEEAAFPDDSRLNTFVEAVKSRYEAEANTVRTVADLLAQVPFWQGNSTEDIAAPLGWDKQGSVISFTLNDAPPHGLLAGKTGSGKSNILHVIIQSLCYVYPPDELRLYLMDFKEGVEFNLYTAPPLPHARLVATSNDVEYGVMVLEHLCAEMKTRSDTFKKKNVKDYTEYRKSSGIMPRILVIIDEFQVLFSDKLAEGRFNDLLRQGRSAGIHLFLATQTIKGIPAVSMSQLTSNIGCRIALTCTEEDSAIILSMNNHEAARLEPKQEAILNIENGQKSGNRIFIHPKAEPAIGKKYLECFAEEARKRGFIQETKIFQGADLPVLPEMLSIEKTKELILELGEELSFESPPFRVALPNKNGGNMLIVEAGERLHRGLLAAIQKSAVSQVDESVMYGAMELAAIREEIGKTRRLLVIEDLENKKELIPPSTMYVPQRNGQTPADLLYSILDDGPSAGTFTVVFSKNWTRINSHYKYILPFLELRIGYKLNEAQAGAVFGVPAGIKGLNNENRALFGDLLNNRQTMFRPYIEKEA